MITIDGSPFDINSLLPEYGNNSIEKTLLVAMNESNESYYYDTLEQLKFELLLRKETANAAIDLNNSRFSFAVFQRSKCNPQFWNRVANGGWMLKNGVSPADAINDIYINGQKYSTECATAMLIVYYRALLKTFGKQKFDRLFPNIYLMNWQINDPLIKEVGIPFQTKDMLIGDRAYFKNPDVSPRTPEWQGENVIILPDNLYYGHGIGIQSARRIIRILNMHRKMFSSVSAYMLNSVSRPNYKKLADYYYN